MSAILNSYGLHQARVSKWGNKDMARLIVEHENRPPQHFPLNRAETFIGRGDDSDLLLPDVSVSRKHCCVRETPDGYELEDLKVRTVPY